MEDTGKRSVLVSEPADSDVLLEGYGWMFGQRAEEVMARKMREILPAGPENAGLKMSPLNIYTERLLACLVSAVQSEFVGTKLGGHVRIAPSERFRNYVDVMVPLRVLLAPGDCKNYSYAAAAAAKLQSVVIPFEYGSKIKFRSVIVEADADKVGGHLLFSVSPEIWHLILDCSKGYRKTEFWVVRSLRNRLSYRFYKLVSGQKNPLVFKISDLVARFAISETNASKPFFFRTRVLDAVRRELDSVSPWSFDYELLQSSELKLKRHSGHAGYDLVRLFPRHIIANERTNDYLVSSVPGHSVSALIDPRLVAHLKNKYGMKDKEIESWRDLLLDADKKIPGGLYAFLLDRTAEIDRNATTNRIGYVHNVIANELSKLI